MTTSDPRTDTITSGTIDAGPAGTTATGLDLLRAVQEGRADGPGAAILLGMRIAGLEEGRVAFEVETRPEHGNPMGTVHGGITATLADSAMGCAVLTLLPATAGYTTVDLSLTYLRAVPCDGRLLRAEGTVIHLGGRIATAECRVTDGHDRLVATGTTTCMIFRHGDGAGT